MNDNLIRRIIYDITIFHLTVSPFEDELYRNDIVQYIYSDKNTGQEPVMLLKQTAGELIYIISKSDPNFITEYLDFTKILIDGVNLRTNTPSNDHLKEGVLFGVEKCIQLIIGEFD